MQHFDMQIARHRRDRRFVINALNQERRAQAANAMTELVKLLRNTQSQLSPAT